MQGRLPFYVSIRKEQTEPFQWVLFPKGPF